MANLIGRRSWSIFNMLNMESEELGWLGEDPSTWVLYNDYRTFTQFARGLQVVNDPAERGIKIIQDFIKVSTDETARQEIILAVSQHRKEHSSKDMTKDSLQRL